MENIQNNTDNKKPVLITVIAGVVVLGALMWWLKQSPQQAQVNPTPDAEAAAIKQAVEGVDVGDLNAEFNAIDTDLQGL